MKRTAFQWLAISSLLATFALAAHARTRPRYGGSLRVETGAQLWSPDGIARALTVETLTHVDELGRVQPWLAIKWDSQNHDKRWLVTIRPGIKMHDGTALTGATVSEILNGCAGCPWRSAQAYGDTVVFEFDTATPLFPAQLATARYGVTRTGSNGAPIGTGPMYVQEATPRSATLAAFDKYWNGRVFLDSVQITAGRSGRDQWLDLGVGRADVAEVSTVQIKRVQQDRLRVLTSRDDELIVLVINSVSPAMQNGTVRQAIAESLDRASLLNVIFQKQGEFTGSLLPNWMTGYGPLFSTSQNLPHARELRSQAGQIPQLTLTYDASDPALQLVAERIALSTRDAGIFVRTTPAPAHWDITLARIRLDSFHPSVALEDLLGTLGLEHKAPDDTTTEALYQHEREILNPGYLVPLLYLPHAFAAGDRVRKWKLNDGGLPAFPDIWMEVRR